MRLETIAGYYVYNAGITVSGASTPTRFEPAGTTLFAGKEYLDIFSYACSPAAPFSHWTSPAA